jgi:ribosomal protein S27AE
VPEFAEPSPRPGPSTCPNCGEAFEHRLDLCWKCGTRRDGSRLKPWTPVEVKEKEVTVEPDELCPKCLPVSFVSATHPNPAWRPKLPSLWPTIPPRPVTESVIRAPI